MPTMSTGLIIAGAYADKVRKVMAAQAKSAGMPVEEAIRAAAELNQRLFDIATGKGIDKGDVVRIKIEYVVEDGKIKWLYDTLTIEHWKKVG